MILETTCAGCGQRYGVDRDALLRGLASWSRCPACRDQAERGAQHSPPCGRAANAVEPELIKVGGRRPSFTEGGKST